MVSGQPGLQSEILYQNQKTEGRRRREKGGGEREEGEGEGEDREREEGGFVLITNE